MATYTTTVTQNGPDLFAHELDIISRSDQNGSERNRVGIEEPNGLKDDTVPPPEALVALQKWNSPSINKYRVFATFWSFLVLGMNDGSYGVSCRFKLSHC